MPIIRPARADEHPALCDLFAELDRFHREVRPDVFIEPQGPSRSPELLAGLIAGPGSTILVAEDGSALAGLATLVERTIPANPVRPERRIVEIDNLVVMPTHRRRGIAGLLLRHAESWARGRGIGALELGVWEFNAGAFACYEAAGFAPTIRRLSKTVAPP
ncbi:GNAT family N-acetyltransferase [Inquilinus sp. Marseille-Q2685]|uniref:GNAT family N-acetyltransferase n=1 Tax=Inquilinus sp. Marseille-Q2685 TaxID=2866581 RepID=UPI001CE3C56C|nr:GNAT family N-acetyltransferase [Inquilinus sp. Marseille-Q2685]